MAENGLNDVDEDSPTAVPDSVPVSESIEHTGMHAQASDAPRFEGPKLSLQLEKRDKSRLLEITSRKSGGKGNGLAWTNARMILLFCVGRNYGLSINQTHIVMPTFSRLQPQQKTESSAMRKMMLLDILERDNDEERLHQSLYASTQRVGGPLQYKRGDLSGPNATEASVMERMRKKSKLELTHSYNSLCLTNISLWELSLEFEKTGQATTEHNIIEFMVTSIFNNAHSNLLFPSRKT